MTRFERELSGALGAYWKTSAEKELHLRCRSINSGRSKAVTAFVYIMDETRPLGRPTDYYLRVCREGYEQFGFDPAILMQAVERSTRS